MNEEKEPLAHRNEAKRLEIQAEKLRIGYFRAHLLPMITWTIMACIVLFAFRHFVIDGTLFADGSWIGRDGRAKAAFENGEISNAEKMIQPVLADAPNLPSANQLMAEIELVKGNRRAAIGYLKTAAETAINRGVILKWIDDLEKADTTPPKTNEPPAK